MVTNYKKLLVWTCTCTCYFNTHNTQNKPTSKLTNKQTNTYKTTYLEGVAKEATFMIHFQKRVCANTKSAGLPARPRSRDCLTLEILGYMQHHLVQCVVVLFSFDSSNIHFTKCQSSKHQTFAISIIVYICGKAMEMKSDQHMTYLDPY